MEIVINFGLLIVGFVLLMKGADIFVDGASKIAIKMHVPEIVVGLTIVAMGTSAPEAAISITAALNNGAAISIGNVIGSNIMNIALILGLTSIIATLPIKDNTLKISDSGIGINEKDLPRIFEKGYTGFNGRLNQKSSGLGLYLVKRSCDMLDHQIKIESKLNIGTDVYLSFNENKTKLD